MILLLKMFLLQAIIFVVVIGVLKKVLERELFLVALEQLQRESVCQVEDVTIVVTRSIPSELDFRFRALLKDKFPGTEPQIAVTSEIWGGVVIKAGDLLLDSSVRGRVRQLFRWGA